MGSKRELILIKIGGSLITDKTKPYTVKRSVIKKLAIQIKEALEEKPDLYLIIGNGGGSFPHYPAVEYQMKEGIKKLNQKFGFALVQEAASKLNRIVVEEFLKNGIKTISFNPSSMIVAENQEIKNFFIDALLGVLNLQMVPVIYGDIVYDKTRGATILSTERLLNYLALFLRDKNYYVKRIIHNGTTPGVLDAKGRVIPTITAKSFSSLDKIIVSVKGYDVTGGMKHKIEEALKIAQFGIQTTIINGIKEKGILKKAILGQRVKGTIITAEEF